MKKILIILLSIVSTLTVSAFEDPGVTANLKARFSSVQYHDDCGGWYLLSNQYNGQSLYGMADPRGNIVVTEGTQYNVYPGYIEFYCVNLQQKQAHDRWEQDMQVYNQNMRTYEATKAKYEAEVEAYNRKVASAKEEAQRIYKIEQQKAIKKAEEENKKRQQQAQQNGGGGILGAILGGLADGLNTVNAGNSVKYEPILNNVLANRDLLVPPAEPYNPRPSKPTEPTGVMQWKKFTLMQPCPYDEVDFDGLKDANNLVSVKKSGKYGLVTGNLVEIYPCSQSNKIIKTSDKKSNRYIVQMAGLQGVIDNKGNKIVECKYNSISFTDNRLLVQEGNKMGLLSLNGEQVMPIIYSSITNENGYLICNCDGKVGIFTTDNDEIFPCEYQSATIMKYNNKRGLLTKLRGEYGLIDFESGKQVLPNNYSEISTINLGGTNYLTVSKKDLKGLYTCEGIMVLPCDFKSIKAENNLFCTTGENGKIGVFDKQGIPLIPANKYDSYKSNKLWYEVVSNGKNGICSFSGDELVPCIYDELKYYEKQNFFVGKRDNRKTIVGLDGKELFEPMSMLSHMIMDDYMVICTSYKNGYGAIDFDGNLLVEDKQKNWEKVQDKIEKMKKKDGAFSQRAAMTLEQMKGMHNNLVSANNEYLSRRSSFSFFAQNYVERTINEWQHRGEFEKLADWQKRVSTESRNLKVFELTKEAQTIFLANNSPKTNNDVVSLVGDYDPDNETFRLQSTYAPGKDLLIKVDMADAQEFRSSLKSLKKSPEFFIENDNIALASYSFQMPSGKVYRYSNQASLQYSVATVEYRFDPITIGSNAGNNGTSTGKQTISTKNITLGTSDVDVQIPLTGKKQEKTFALIIANEHYENEKNVEYAYNDGQVFRDYCVKTLGLPNENVHFYPNATYMNIKKEMTWLKNVAKSYNGEAKFIVYYAGHGMPDDATKDAYLLPVDGYSSDITSGVKLSSIYETLGDVPSQNVMMFVDACFSGTHRSGETLGNARSVALKPNLNEPKGNLVVFSAASGSETAHPYADKGHGLFTYFLLKKLQESEGDISLGDLSDYVIQEVSRKVVVTGKTQTPCVTPAPTLENWRNLRMQ